jgi:hypothetical protein
MDPFITPEREHTSARDRRCGSHLRSRPAPEPHTEENGLVTPTEIRKATEVLEAVLAEVENGEFQATDAQRAYIAGALEVLRAVAE